MPSASITLCNSPAPNAWDSSCTWRRVLHLPFSFLTDAVQVATHLTMSQSVGNVSGDGRQARVWRRVLTWSVCGG